MKKYETTKEQINEYVEQHPCCGATKQTLQDLFPDAFKKELKLESGKWYVGYHYSDRFLVCLNLTDELETQDKGYGFTKSGWSNKLAFLKTFDYGFELATEEEVYEALKKEAVKRGYKEKDIVTDIYYSGYCALNQNGFEYNKRALWMGDCVLFQNGQWAEKIPTKTRSEAEKELNCKIID